MLIFVYTELLTSFIDIATFPLPTIGSKRIFPFKLYVASIRNFGINRSKLNSFFSRSRLGIDKVLWWFVCWCVKFRAFDFWTMTYLARLTVEFDGPLTIKFLKPPASVKLPLPRDTDTDCKISGSKCSMPNSGIPVKWINYCFSFSLKFDSIFRHWNELLTFSQHWEHSFEHLSEAIILSWIVFATLF